jgi:ABC-2 type transport system permease protein
MTNSMSTIITIAKQELRTLVREKTFLLLLGIFLVMTAFAVAIGASTRSTTFSIYHATVTVLQTAGKNVPPNPLLGITSLSVFDNMIIYILLVGALLSIVIGHRSFIRERKSGIVSLVFTRPVSKVTYIMGKLTGIGVALASIMVCTFVVSVISTFFITTVHLSGIEFLRLGGFYLISFFYLAFFAVLGLLCAIRIPSESIALFTPIIVWVALVFILPELATGQNPVALLNPITLARAAPNMSAFFVHMRTIIEPFSVSQYYTESALMFLKAGPTSGLSLSAGITQVWLVMSGPVLYLFVLIGASVLAVRSYVVSSDPLL